MKTPKITSIRIILTLSCFACLPLTRAVSPTPDGCYPGFTTAEGSSALQNLTSGAGNTGVGWRSLFSNSTGSFNTALGAGTLLANTGSNNTAVGAAALLSNTTGSNNTALGASAGTDPGIGSNNVYIGDPGFGGDNNVISIGGIAASGTDYDNTYIGGIYGGNVNAGTALLVYVDTDGHLGTNPVNASGSKLRTRSPEGAQPQANLNEFQKQQTRTAELESTIARLKSTDAKQEATIAKQQRQIDSLTADLQRVSAQLEASRPAPQVVTNP
jgi:uncharacterized coiled-coil protein SlyX